MNNLSWLLYFAGVAGNFQITLALIGTCLLFYCFACLVLEHTKNLTRNVVLGVFVCLISSCIPSKDTIYLIAASEMGEEALQTETAQKVGDYLDFLLEDLTGVAE